MDRQNSSASKPCGEDKQNLSSGPGQKSQMAQSIELPQRFGDLSYEEHGIQPKFNVAGARNLTSEQNSQNKYSNSEFAHENSVQIEERALVREQDKKYDEEGREQRANGDTHDQREQSENAIQLQEISQQSDAQQQDKIRCAFLSRSNCITIFIIVFTLCWCMSAGVIHWLSYIQPSIEKSEKQKELQLAISKCSVTTSDTLLLKSWCNFADFEEAEKAVTDGDNFCTTLDDIEPLNNDVISRYTYSKPKESPGLPCSQSCLGDPKCHTSWSMEEKKDEVYCVSLSDFKSIKQVKNGRNYKFHICREKIPYKGQIVKATDNECKSECAKNDWCQSFDYCERQQFCHLKNITSSDYQKQLKTGDENSNFYSCKDEQRKEPKLKLQQAFYLMGQNRTYTYTNCRFNNETKSVHCPGEYLYNKTSGQFKPNYELPDTLPKLTEYVHDKQMSIDMGRMIGGGAAYDNTKLTAEKCLDLCIQFGNRCFNTVRVHNRGSGYVSYYCKFNVQKKPESYSSETHLDMGELDQVDWLQLRDQPLNDGNIQENVRIQVDESVKGARGLRVKIWPFQDNETKWFHQPSDNANVTWNMQTIQHGVLPLFNNSRATKYDQDAYQDNCFKMFEWLGTDVCGYARNNLLNENSTQLLVRGTSGLWYYPQSEVDFRVVYTVVTDVWNFNIYWRNLILASILLSTIFFTLFYVKSSNQLQEQVQVRTSKIGKVLIFVDRCGILEIIDFVKDITYVVFRPHSSVKLTICLWVSTVFTVLFTAFTILSMSAQEYVDQYGLKDFKDKERADQVTCCNLLKAKPIRILKECFNIYSEEEYNDSKVKQKLTRHRFMTNMFENLPQTILQLYETFELGFTFGFLKSFSIIFSLMMMQKGSGQMLPLILVQIRNFLGDQNKKTFRVIKIIVILLVWLFPYAVSSIPFLVFFHSDQTAWLKENGFDPIDVKPAQQEKFQIVLYLTWAAYVLLVLFWILKRKYQEIVKRRATMTQVKGQ